LALARGRVNSAVRRYQMLKMLAITATLLVTSVTSNEHSLSSPTANQQIDNCETVYIDCPETVDERSDINFRATVQRAAGPLLPLHYHWSLSGVPKARIKSGRGTATIVVSVPQRATGRLTATVTVTPVTKGCNNAASCSTDIGRRP
jgi:hypothetical protein